MGKTALMIGGVINVLIGLLHAVIIFAGPEAYVYFGAGQEMADMDAAGSLIPDIITLLLAVVFIIFGLYAFSGAGSLRRLPLLRVALWTIGAIYTARGLMVIMHLIQYFDKDYFLELHSVVFSAVALLIGLLYLSGAAQYRKMTGT